MPMPVSVTRMITFEPERRAVKSGDGDATALGREPHRVAEQVPDDLLQARDVGHRRRDRCIEIELEAHALGVRGGPHRVDGADDRDRDLRRGSIER